MELAPLLLLLLLSGEMLQILLVVLPSASLEIGTKCGGVGSPEVNGGVLSELAASMFSISPP